MAAPRAGKARLFVLAISAALPMQSSWIDRSGVLLTDSESLPGPRGGRVGAL